ncbi:DUF2017 domain-containing protein [Gryllotalpicola ginsengisoli]|uniref:DUF2017 domain-containing protein n=1 Tax=Gryllotalpicola ginsengisoli TaxID=444608 RepID=UPI000421FFD0|nr:DUF2017 domain-containing protein [Gryllotalpicola ginsengisoli]
MIVRPTRDGRVRAEFDEVERDMLAQLTNELVDLLTQTDAGPDAAADPALPRDPALERLLPDAYREDADAAAEFRRFTEDDLLALKTGNALTVARGAADGSVVLTESEVLPWLRTLTDLRLALATRLGIETDEDEGSDAPELAPAKAAYWWLGELQERLIRALEAHAG